MQKKVNACKLLDVVSYFLIQYVISIAYGKNYKTCIRVF